MDRISIVTVCFNCADIIENTIKSCVGQHYENKEYLIIDGGSVDGTLNIIANYKSSIDYFISEEDNGIYDAMNKAIMQATGDWIIFMNAGDLFLNSSVISDVFQNASYPKNIGVLYADFYEKNDRYIRLSVCNMPFWKNCNYLHGSGLNHQSCFTRLSLAQKYLFQIDLRNGADFKQMNDIYLSGFDFRKMSTPICFFDVNDGFYMRHPAEAIKENAMILGRYKTLKFYICFLLQLYDWEKMVFRNKVYVWLKNNFPEYYDRKLKSQGWVKLKTK